MKGNINEFQTSLYTFTHATHISAVAASQVATRAWISETLL